MPLIAKGPRSWPPRSQRPQRARSFKGPRQMELSLRTQGLRRWNGRNAKPPPFETAGAFAVDGARQAKLGVAPRSRGNI